VTDPGPVAARASLDVARAAVGQMMSSDGAPARIPPVTMATRAKEAWESCEHVLHNVTGRVDLSGQPLLAEARKQNRISLNDAHALVAMSDWVERTRAPGSAAQMLTLPPTDAEREVATNAFVALQHAVASVTGDAGDEATVASLAPVEAYAQPASKTSADPNTPQFAQPIIPNTPQLAQPIIPNTPQKPNVPVDTWVRPPYVPPHAEEFQDGGSSKRKTGGIVALILVLVVAGSGGGWYLWQSRADHGSASSSTTDEGVAAYTSGAREAASTALTKAVSENPNDARAYTYLGRIAREDGNLAQAKKYLELAIAAQPTYALALREMASALLADSQPDLARKFYIRALSSDANDHVSQGFLGCALMKLNRPGDAAPWFARAGQGDWSKCATTTPTP
jgi:tetratricopeptide (TPR) repeat protein